MPFTAREKWDWLSLTYDLMTFGEDRRQGAEKRRLFTKVQGRTLLVAVGTGNDLKYLPPDCKLIAIDISPRMIQRARINARRAGGNIRLVLTDAERLGFADQAFDTVLTVCTFCSIPNPVQGLQELYRVLKPGGTLLMFEHVRSKIGLFALILDFMTFLTRKFGPDLNRDTVGSVLQAGFRLQREENVYLDIVKAIEAVK
ncbi:MAG: class I SAM-dependent methyltransferase [Nitrospirae bacterium]|nr:class I SAM-dependent methyltransferase [Nitrospirota bacterium]